MFEFIYGFASLFFNFPPIPSKTCLFWKDLPGVLKNPILINQPGYLTVLHKNQRIPRVNGFSISLPDCVFFMTHSSFQVVNNVKLGKGEEKSLVSYKCLLIGDMVKTFFSCLLIGKKLENLNCSNNSKHLAKKHDMALLSPPSSQ